MTRRIRVPALAAAAVLALSLWAGSASASEQTLTSLGKITFLSPSNRVECNVTLQATFVDWRERPAEGSHAGSITGTTISGCEGGTFRAALGLPWGMENVRTLGRSPTLTGILVELRGVSLAFSTFGPFSNCLWEGRPGLLIEVFEAGEGRHTFGLAHMLEEHLAKHEGALCPLEIAISGSFRIA